jgi:hypothetical protein
VIQYYCKDEKRKINFHLSQPSKPKIENLAKRASENLQIGKFYGIINM